MSKETQMKDSRGASMTANTDSTPKSLELSEGQLEVHFRRLNLARCELGLRGDERYAAFEIAAGKRIGVHGGRLSDFDPAQITLLDIHIFSAFHESAVRRTHKVIFVAFGGRTVLLIGLVCRGFFP